MTEMQFTEIHMGRGAAPHNYPYNPKKRPKPKQRRKIIKGRMAQNDKCYYCGIKMVFRDICQHTHDEVTLDHKHPIVKGSDGRKKKNIVLACYSCNKNKKEMTEEEYRQTSSFKNRVEHVEAIENSANNEKDSAP